MAQLICLEGADGTGKTTVARLLAERLPGIYFASPGNPFREIRSLVAEADVFTSFWFYRTANQFDSATITKLLEGGNVIIDRFADSTLIGHAVREPRINKIFDKIGLVVPNHTVVLTASPTRRMERLSLRSTKTALESSSSMQDRMDEMYRALGHPIFDTTDTTVEQAATYIMTNILRPGVRG